MTELLEALVLALALAAVAAVAWAAVGWHRSFARWSK